VAIPAREDDAGLPRRVLERPDDRRADGEIRPPCRRARRMATPWPAESLRFVEGKAAIELGIAGRGRRLPA
jgi:hypothetical protein